MANYDHLKLQALEFLEAGNSAKATARRLNIPYTQVLSWKREHSHSQTKDDVSKIIEMEPAVIHEIAEDVEERLGELMDPDEAEETVSGVLEQLNKLGVLERDLQSASINVVRRLEALIDSAPSATEIEVIVECLAKLQNAFFAKGANVNILNTGGAVSNAPISRYSDMQRES